ncbi:hypothetical protein D3C74_489410 [compost metagenome]
MQDQPSGILATLIELESRYPSPREEKKNSPTIAPIMLAVALIFNAVKTYGRLLLIRRWRNTADFGAA